MKRRTSPSLSFTGVTADLTERNGKHSFAQRDSSRGCECTMPKIHPGPYHSEATH